MHPNRRTRSAAVALGAVLLGCLIAALAACGAAAGDTPTPTGSPNPRPPGQVELGATAGTVGDYLRQDFPDHYAGMTLDSEKPTVIVYRRPSSELDAALREKFRDVPIELRDAPHSARELDAIARRVTGDIGYWEGQGISITSIVALTDGSAVEVGTREVAKATVELPKRYGRAPIEITEINPMLLTPDELAPRTTSPTR
ncbi:hypothetical protein [Streptosporangium subroseum]|uniref:hypothetical protein n=1 Tax=Streptosporangium subroseum TaxID=106412 RepID=UPI003091EB74|nr:hypothetical protein OHB15_24415 [Streptosporangium subroseum]